VPGFPLGQWKNVDAYQKTQRCSYRLLRVKATWAGSDIRQLAHMPEVLKLLVRAYREALRALRTSVFR